IQPPAPDRRRRRCRRRLDTPTAPKEPVVTAATVAREGIRAMAATARMRRRVPVRPVEMAGTAVIPVLGELAAKAGPV
ncbi:hypothetical protein OSH91_24900, partial [Mycobacterium ulcerans]